LLRHYLYILVHTTCNKLCTKTSKTSPNLLTIYKIPLFIRFKASQAVLKSALYDEQFNLYIFADNESQDLSFEFREIFSESKVTVSMKCSTNPDSFENSKPKAKLKLAIDSDVISVRKGGSGKKVANRPIRIAGARIAPAKPSNDQSDPVIFDLNDSGDGFNLTSTLRPSGDKKILRARLKRSSSLDIQNNGSQDFTSILRHGGKNGSVIKQEVKVGETSNFEFRKGTVKLDIQRIDSESDVPIDLDITIARSESGRQKIDFHDIIGSTEFNLTGTFDSFLSSERIAVPILFAPTTVRVEVKEGDFTVNIYRGKKANEKYRSHRSCK
jgi:hypothetical protein